LTIESDSYAVGGPALAVYTDAEITIASADSPSTGPS